MNKVTIFKDIDILTPYEYITDKCLVIENSLIKGIYNSFDDVKKTVDTSNA